mmetsp:Transcript_34119/g.95928  ORF Transcript_34119/g.95928 Transcript_34119/m.95928 type:complete len:242 (-) Transcript_34119:322-1047(-)
MGCRAWYTHWISLKSARAASFWPSRAIRPFSRQEGRSLRNSSIMSWVHRCWLCTNALKNSASWAHRSGILYSHTSFLRRIAIFLSRSLTLPASRCPISSPTRLAAQWWSVSLEKSLRDGISSRSCSILSNTDAWWSMMTAVRAARSKGRSSGYGEMSTYTTAELLSMMLSALLARSSWSNSIMSAPSKDSASKASAIRRADPRPSGHPAWQKITKPWHPAKRPAQFGRYPASSGIWAGYGI